MSLLHLDDADLLKILWNDRDADVSVFDREFHEELSESGLRHLFERAREEAGVAETVRRRPGGPHYTVVTPTHDVAVNLARDGERRVCGLWLHTAVPRHATLRHALDALRAERTELSWLLRRDGERVDGHDAGRALAVGSGFKLWVLDAYRRAVADGERRRDDVVSLRAHHRSWPSGILQDAPAGMPVTLETLATLMIAMSDNTATDALVDVLGRERIEALSPFAPLMTTKEVSRLRLDAGLERRYSEADAAGRRALLASMPDADLPPPAGHVPGPLPGAEWYASAEALCDVIERVADEPATGVATGLVDRAGWTRVADKAGGEEGVRSGTARLVAANGTVWCLAVTWNGTIGENGRPVALDDSALTAKLDAVVSSLAREP